MAENIQIQKPVRKFRLSDLFAVIALILIVAVIIWGLIHAARLASPWFASLFPKQTTPSSPTVTVNKMHPLPDPFTKPQPIPQPTTKPTPEKPVVKKPIVTGPADLSVTITYATIDQYGNGVVTFDIKNVGGTPTGVYAFTAQLPTSYGYQYVSPPQYSLAPGDHVQNTLNFSQGIAGIISIQIDPYNVVSEKSEGNNYASQQVGFNGYYNPQPNYYPQPYVY